MGKGKLKILTCVFVCAAIFLASLNFSFWNLGASAISFPCYAKISRDKAAVYSLPGTTGHEADKSTKSVYLATLYQGDIIKIIGQGIDGDGDKWYLAQYGNGYSKQGYVYSGRVELQTEYHYDKDFEEYLNGQGFPESYKDGLRNLHAIYPKWVFVADKTGYDFYTAVNNEYNTGKLIGKNSDDSLKSMAKGDYNWNGDDSDYILKDSGAWVRTTARVVAYYMDPRNFLTPNDAFMFLQQSYSSNNSSIEQIETAVKGTFMDGKLPDSDKRYAEVIFDAARQLNVNPFTIVGLIRQEQGVNGTSRLISGTVPGYEGIYNYFNVGAFAGNGMDTVTRGLWWAAGAPSSNGSVTTSYGRPWNTAEKSIKGGVQYQSEGYISKGQDTFYYMDYNVSPYSQTQKFDHQYATNVADAVGKGRGSAGAYESIIDSAALTFRIPVYENMPDSTSLPQSGTNNNCYLNSLSVAGFEGQTETFDRYNNEYELVVPYSSSSVEITANRSDSGAQLSGTGIKDLNVGLNVFEIKVTATSGLENVYTIKISREKGSGEDVPKPEIDMPYKNGEFLTGIEPGTTADVLRGNINIRNGSIKIIDKNGNEKQNGVMATGDVIYVFNNNGDEVQNFRVVIYGDINGDGRITSVDLLVGQRHILHYSTLDGAFLEAADINHDYRITSVDLLVGQRHILNIKQIVQ